MVEMVSQIHAGQLEASWQIPERRVANYRGSLTA